MWPSSSCLWNCFWSSGQLIWFIGKRKKKEGNNKKVYGSWVCHLPFQGAFLEPSASNFHFHFTPGRTITHDCILDYRGSKEMIVWILAPEGEILTVGNYYNVERTFQTFGEAVKQMTPTYLSIPERALSSLLSQVYLVCIWNFFCLKLQCSLLSLSKLIWPLHRVVVKIRVRVCKVPSINT